MITLNSTQRNADRFIFLLTFLKIVSRLNAKTEALEPDTFCRKKPGSA